jgi:predicted phage terminase large subunit-like protein
VTVGYEFRSNVAEAHPADRELAPTVRLRAGVEQLGATRRAELARALTPRFPAGKRYIPHVPHPPQQAFLLLNFIAEVFYGGAAGGGKSDAGLMGALQYADVPGYSALILRRTFPDLSLPGAIMDRAEEWLSGTGARKRDGGKRWEFPTPDPARPATLQFGYAASHADIRRYQGAEFQFVFVDELTHFEERTYRYVFSRLRGPAVPCASCSHMTSQPAGEPRQHDEDHDHCACGHEHPPFRACEGPADRGGICGCADYRPTGCDCLHAEADREAVDELGNRLLIPAPDGTTLADVPLRMRSGSNPGGVGHEWVRSRFVDPATRSSEAVFVPAKLADNPSLDRKAYRASLAHLTEVERQRLEEGDWNVADDGDVFDRHWFRIVDEVPAGCRYVRFWDMAATVEKVTKRKKNDPDWTVGTLAALSPAGQWYVVDVIRFRKAPYETEQAIRQTAAVDGRAVAVRWEEEGGSSGKITTDHYRRTVLPGFDADGVRPQLSKEERARPVATAAQAGNVMILSAPWNREWLDEFAGFPNLPHDDQVDSLSGAVESLTTARRARIIA